MVHMRINMHIYAYRLLLLLLSTCYFPVISKQMNHLKIFRFDAIPSPSGRGYVLIKFVILPIMIYDGLPDAPERVLNLLVSRSVML